MFAKTVAEDASDRNVFPSHLALRWQASYPAMPAQQGPERVRLLRRVVDGGDGGMGQVVAHMCPQVPLMEVIPNVQEKFRR